MELLDSMIPQDADLGFLTQREIDNLIAHDKAIFQDEKIFALFRTHCMHPDDCDAAIETFGHLNILSMLAQNKLIDARGHSGYSMACTTVDMIEIWCRGFHDWRKSKMAKAQK